MSQWTLKDKHAKHMYTTKIADLIKLDFIYFSLKSIIKWYLEDFTWLFMYTRFIQQVFKICHVWQVERKPPPLPEQVKYFKLPEVTSDVTNPWVVLRHVSNFLAVGQINEEGDVVVKVCLDDSLKAQVTKDGTLCDNNIVEIKNNTNT